MPIFEYFCKDCGADFDIYLPASSDGRKVVCPSCNSENVRKVYHVNHCSSSENSGGNSDSGSCFSGGWGF